MSVAHAAPAGLSRRYAAWSLDMAPVLLVAALTSADTLRNGATRIAEAFDALVQAMARAMLDLLAQGGSPLELSQAWLADPAQRALVTSLSEAIAEEARGTGVTVTTLCPGPTRTAFFARANMRESKLARRAVMGAAEVAAAGYAGMMRGDRVVVPGAGNRAMAALVRIAPRRIVTRIVARLNRTRRSGSGADAAAG